MALLLRYLAEEWPAWRITTYIKERIDHPLNEAWVLQLVRHILDWSEWSTERKTEAHVRAVILRMYTIIHHTIIIHTCTCL